MVLGRGPNYFLGVVFLRVLLLAPPLVLGWPFDRLSVLILVLVAVFVVCEARLLRFPQKVGYAILLSAHRSLTWNVLSVRVAELLVLNTQLLS